MANVGKNIKKLRVNSKMTQDALAEQLFVSRQTVSNYENGKSNPDIDMLVKMAEIFGTDANELIYGPPVPVKHKREYIQLGIVTALLVLTGIAVIAVEQSGLAEWFYYRFITWPGILLHMIVKPFVCLGIGWAVMQTAGLFFGAKRPKSLQGKTGRICRRVIISLMILYLIITLPSLIHSGIDHWQLWQAERQGLGYNHVYRSILPREITQFLSRMWYKFLFFNRSYSVVYLLPGIFLWASATAKTESEPQAVQPEKSPK